MKIVINRCYGGFGLSKEAMIYYAKLKGLTLYPDNDRLTPTYWLTPTAKAEYDELYKEAKKTGNYKESNEFYYSNMIYYGNIKRDDPLLVQTVEDLGSEVASGMYAKLEVVDIPKGTAYRINEYDGMESIETNPEGAYTADYVENDALYRLLMAIGLEAKDLPERLDVIIDEAVAYGLHEVPEYTPLVHAMERAAMAQRDIAS